MRRRTYLVGAASAALASGGTSMAGRRVAATDSSDSDEVVDVTRAGGLAGVEREPAYAILSGTPHETPVYVVESDGGGGGSGESGSTALVVGGIHGDERSGYLTAERVADWSFEAGRVVVLPRANRVAVRRGTREGESGDLNRQFPPGGEPRTDVARAVWGVVERHDPDVLVDLHRSKGIYGFHREFVGQTVFPSVVDDGVAVAEATVDRLNRAVPWYMPFHRFGVGNVARGTAPLLHHKFVGDRGQPSYIVETTTYLTDLRRRVEWTTIAATELLAHHGIERAARRTP